MIKNVDLCLNHDRPGGHVRGCLLLAGTPLRNNSTEALALLSLLPPEISSVYADLDSLLHKVDTTANVEEGNSKEVMDTYMRYCCVNSNMEENFLLSEH
jgi:SWI/SNF-related matrix-associated actin-dependent regulator of chromatin subfamily A member 5